MAISTASETFVAVETTAEVKRIEPNRGAMNVATKIMGEFGVGVVFMPLYSGLVYRAVPANNGNITLARNSEVMEVGKQIGVVRVHGSGFKSNHEVPVLNGPNLCRFSYSTRLHEQVACGLMPPTVYVRPGQAYEPNPAITGNSVVIKYRSPEVGRYIERLENNPAKINAAIKTINSRLRYEGVATDHDFMVQPYDPGRAIFQIESTTKGAAALVKYANDSTRPEVRVYCFPDNVGGKISIRPYAMYNLNSGAPENVLLPIDQTTVPKEIILNAARVASGLLRIVGVNAAVMAVDQYLSSDGTFKVRSINCGNLAIGDRLVPAFKGLSGDLAARVVRVAEHAHGQLLAEQLATVALGRKCKF